MEKDEVDAVIARLENQLEGVEDQSPERSEEIEDTSKSADWHVQLSRSLDWYLTQSKSSAWIRMQKNWRTVYRALQHEYTANPALFEIPEHVQLQLDEIESVGEAAPGDSRRIARDVSYVLQRLRDLYTDERAELWLTSYNVNLNTRPIDAIVRRRVAEVISALELEEELGYG